MIMVMVCEYVPETDTRTHQWGYMIGGFKDKCLRN